MQQKLMNSLTILWILTIYFLRWMILINSSGMEKHLMLKYIPGSAKAAYQGQLEKTETKRKYTDESCKSKKVIEFNIQLAGNQYTIFCNIHLFPDKK